MKSNIYFPSYFAKFFLEWEMFHTKFEEKIRIDFTVHNFLPVNRAVYETITKDMVETDRSQVTIEF
jgi:hypothetical protein